MKLIQPRFSEYAYPEKTPDELIVTPPLDGAKLIQPAFSLQAYVRAGWEYNAIAYRVDVERKQHSAELSVRQMEINSHTQLLAEWKNERAGIQAPTQHPRITEL